MTKQEKTERRFEKTVLEDGTEIVTLIKEPKEAPKPKK